MTDRDWWNCDDDRGPALKPVELRRELDAWVAQVNGSGLSIRASTAPMSNHVEVRLMTGDRFSVTDLPYGDVTDTELECELENLLFLHVGRCVHGGSYALETAFGVEGTKETERLPGLPVAITSDTCLACRGVGCVYESFPHSVPCAACEGTGIVFPRSEEEHAAALAGLASIPWAEQAQQARQALVAVFRSEGMQVPEITKDLERLAAMTDEEVNAELRKLGATDEQIQQTDKWARELAEEMASHARRHIKCSHARVTVDHARGIETCDDCGDGGIHDPSSGR